LTLEFDHSLHFGEANHDNQICSEIQVKFSCFRRHIGLVGVAKARTFTFCGKIIYNVNRALPQLLIGYKAAAEISPWG
jgi:hypothetical protein